MTYKAMAYQGIIDIDILISVAEKQLMAYRAKQRFVRAICDDVGKKEVDLQINFIEKYIKETKSILDDIMEKMDILADTMNDTEQKVFVLMYYRKMGVEEISEELHICSSRIYEIVKSIKKKMQNDVGEELNKQLSE